MPRTCPLILAALAALVAGPAPGWSQTLAPSGANDLSAAAAAFAATPQPPLISYRRDDAAAAPAGPATENNSLRAADPAAPTAAPPYGAAASPDVGIQPATAVQDVASPFSEAPLAGPSAPAGPLPSPPTSMAPPFRPGDPSVPTGGVDRRLAPPSPRMRRYDGDASTRGAASFLPQAFGKFKSLSSAGAALAVVVALFLICISLVRRGGPKSTGMLPSEAFSVLGRSPLTPQSYAQLLRLGNKLVLVAVGAEGAQTLAEVTDPLEVDRIAGLCATGAPHGPSAEFQQVLAQLSREPAKGFLGREASSARRRG